MSVRTLIWLEWGFWAVCTILSLVLLVNSLDTHSWGWAAVGLAGGLGAGSATGSLWGDLKRGARK